MKRDKIHPSRNSGWDVTSAAVRKSLAEKSEPKNKERPELSRVQDARAALPQNCSPKKIRWFALPAYGTSVPYPLLMRPLSISLKDRSFAGSRRKRHSPAL